MFAKFKEEAVKVELAFKVPMSLPEQQIPGYQLLGLLGQGAMGGVFKARQLSMDRLVAIKVLMGRYTSNPKFLQRFRQEARIAAKLSHNNIVQAIDVASAGNVHYLVMEYVEGRSIQQELDAGRKFTEKEATDIVLQIAQAIDHAHRRGLIHRDIKPANILLTKDGIAKLADLGTAREMGDTDLARAEQGLTIGTPFYISPEQAAGKSNIDGRADIYSLGATFYHMVTGRPPFPGPGVDAVLQAHLKQPLTPPQRINPELSPTLSRVITMMMAKDPSKRYQKPEGLIIDLECLLSGEAPRLAQPKLEASTLLELAEGEVVSEEDDDDFDDRPRSVRRPRRRRRPQRSNALTVILVLALAISLLLNALLLLRLGH
jgi:serine/threonine-protein kinase